MYERTILDPDRSSEAPGREQSDDARILKRGEITYRQYGPRTIRIDEGEVQKYIDRHTKVGGNGHIEEEIVSWR